MASTNSDFMVSRGIIINPRRTRMRVAVVILCVLCVCACVCLSVTMLAATYHRSGYFR